MKIRPEDLFLNLTTRLENNIYYISGNDETYIKRVQSIILEKLNNRGFVATKHIENVSEYKKNSNLFFESEVIIINSTNGINEKFIKEVENNNDALIVAVKNRPGDNVLKKLFETKQKLSLIICYELTRELKSKILNSYINKGGLNIEKDAYWYLVDILDNKFVFLEKEIQKIILLNKKNIGITLIKKTLSLQENKNFEGLFFALLLSNKKIVQIYNSLISTHLDCHLFLQRAKFFLEIIVSSSSPKEAESKFPKYLFKEKDSFLQIYRLVKNTSLKSIVDLLYETEKNLRKSGGLFKPIGLIFVLKLKKIIFNA